MIFLRLRSKTLFSVFDTNLGARAFFVDIARLSGEKTPWLERADGYETVKDV